MEDEILQLLESNPDISLEEISKILNRDKEEIERMLKELERKGVIKKKYIINWEKIGRDRVYALIEVKVSPERGKGYDRVAERIARFDEVKAVYLISGEYDLEVIVEGKSLKEIASFVSNKLATLEGVKSTVTHFILKKYKENGEIFFEEEKDYRLKISL